MKVYIVCGYSGIRDSDHSWMVGVFKTREKAEEWATKAEKRAKEIRDSMPHQHSQNDYLAAMSSNEFDPDMVLDLQVKDQSLYSVDEIPMLDEL